MNSGCLLTNIRSNCVINLVPDKEAVLREAYRVLKTGGELYFSDVYSDRRVPTELTKDPVLWGECISGALYWNDFLTIAKKVGFKDPRLVEDSKIEIKYGCIHLISLTYLRQKKIRDLIGSINFYSATYRLFKLPTLEPSCEDYGQAVIYKGGISTCPFEFKLDAHHVMPKGKVFPVCSNTYDMLKQTRFAPYFTFIGDTSTHYGIFDGCGSSTPFSSKSTSSNDTPTKSSCC
jgi:arsenite methyltransferase